MPNIISCVNPPYCTVNDYTGLYLIIGTGVAVLVILIIYALLKKKGE
jgi:hypothetical protein